MKDLSGGSLLVNDVSATTSDVPFVISIASLDRFVSRLNYHRLSETLIKIGKEFKLTTIHKIEHKTVTIMLDKGRIGKSDCTAVIVTVHDSPEGPLFCDLGYPFKSREDYLYTPAGLTAYLRHHFTWTEVQDTSILWP